MTPARVTLGAICFSTSSHFPLTPYSLVEKPVQSWISTSDADGDLITQYQFLDAGMAADSGYFWTADIGQRAANEYITVDAADLATTWVRGGQVTGSELMWVRAFDGTDWSAWDAFTLNTSVV